MTQEQERELARQYGAIRAEDARRGKGWCYFKIGKYTIWIGSYHWMVAELVDNHYVGHQKFDSLKEAFDYCSVMTPA